MNKYIATIKKIMEQAEQIETVCENEYSKTHFKCDLYGYKKGRNFILPYQDHMFVHDLDALNSDDRLLTIDSLHNGARKQIDQLFKVPKFLRTRVPNIFSVFISQKHYSDDEIKLAGKSTRTMSGGEFHSIYLIDLASSYLHCQGRSYVQVEGIRHHFKKVDPQNRSYYLVEQIANELFQL